MIAKYNIVLLIDLNSFEYYILIKHNNDRNVAFYLIMIMIFCQMIFYH